MYRFILKNYKALLKSGIITLIITIILVKIDVIFIDSGTTPKYIFIVINSIGFGISWLLIAYLVSKFSIYKVLGVLGLLITAAVAEYYLAIKNNPYTIPLIILFWLGFAYLLLPQFFKKYQITILSVYGLVIGYYLFDFITTPNYKMVNRGNFANFILLPIPFFTALWGYEHWRLLKTLKSDKAKAELTMLKSQINPHFFFNTLNNLYGLVVEKSEKAPEVVLKLSNMMRYTIYESSQ